MAPLKEWKEKKPLLFLEYEGVLVVPGAQVPVAAAVQALNTLLGQTGGELVLSTEWRLNKTRAYMESELKEWGVTKARVVGLLPHLTEGENIFSRKARAIAMWFMHTKRLPLNEEVFALLTPDDLPGPVCAGRLVKPKAQVFTGADIATVKGVLEGQRVALEKCAKDEAMAAL